MVKIIRATPAGLSLLLSLCMLAAPAISLAEGGELPPIELFFETPEVASVRLSPDGESIALLVHGDGDYYVIVRQLDGSAAAPVGKFDDPSFQPEKVMWANDQRLLVSGVQRYRGGIGVRARQTVLFGVDRDGENLRMMSKKWRNAEYIQIQDDIIHPLPEQPKHVLMQIRMPDEHGPGAYRMNVRTGGLKRVVDPVLDIQVWVADRDGRVRLGYGVDPPLVRLIARASEKDDFEKLAEFHVTEGQGLNVLGFTRDPDVLLVAARRPHDRDPQGDRVSVWAYSISKRAFGDLVFAHDRVDVDGGIVYVPGTRKPVAIEYYVDQRELHFLDEEFAALQRGLDKALPDRTNVIIDAVREGRLLLVRSSAANVAPQTYVINRDEGRAHFLFASYPELSDVELVTPKPIRFAARDGLEIPGYLTLPPGGSKTGLPAVLLVHGGPWSRDRLEFDRDVQFLASRGYAVLQVNFRGSTGYGWRHVSGGIKRLGLEMQDDLTDAAAWLVEQGIADPNRIAIMGTSYGGYAALMAAVKTPKVFRAAASYAGVFDWEAEMKHDRKYAGGEIAKEFFGGDDEAVRRASPIHFADRVEIPVLLGHGIDDSNVHVDQSKKMAKALEKAGKQVELVLYEDESHGLALEKNRIDYARHLERFLAENLAAAPAGEEAPADAGL